MYTLVPAAIAPQTFAVCHWPFMIKFRTELFSPCCELLAKTLAATNVCLTSIIISSDLMVPGLHYPYFLHYFARLVVRPFVLKAFGRLQKDSAAGLQAKDLATILDSV